MNKDPRLTQAITAIKAGDKTTGRKLLLTILRENQNDETALLWLSTTTADPTRKRQCFERVLNINPNSETAKRGLAKLENVKAEIESTKKCPYCAEVIKVEATICRFCGMDLIKGEKVGNTLAQSQMMYVATKKEPILAGCLNVIIPGLGHIYIGNWGRGILTFIFSIIILLVLGFFVFFDGGLCTGPAAIFALIILFFEGQQSATRYNVRLLESGGENPH